MDIVEQITDAIEGHETEVKQGIDAVGDFIDSQTGGQYTAQVDQAQDFLKGQVGGDSQ
jgi:hypothetical protein